MKAIFILSAFFVLFISSLAIAQTYVEEEFIVEGAPVYTQTAPSGPPAVVTTVPGVPVPVLVPGEQDVYVGMGSSHVREVMGPPTYVEKFRRFTRRHHGIYDEVWTYAGPGGNLVLYMKERRVQKIGHE